jgi:hypothetical protein
LTVIYNRAEIQYNGLSIIGGFAKATNVSIANAFGNSPSAVAASGRMSETQSSPAIRPLFPDVRNFVSQGNNLIGQ